jgi:asparagine synthase (glutamine-hydrolysing)
MLPLRGGTVAALGHRRLSIIDLAGGGQPMMSHDGRYTVVFNGEVYNYKELRQELLSAGAHFVTSSDTEVILEGWRQWGEQCLLKFRGMFAFALHDAVDCSVVLARDHFGKKPLFIWERKGASGDEIVFGSEIQAVLRHPELKPELDDSAVYEFLMWRYVPGPSTFFRGIRKLPPGSLMMWRDGVVRERRYWYPPEEAAIDRHPPADPVGAFREVFDDAVRLRLRADVPVGAFLSGGLDSASVVASLAHLGANDIRTFSVGFAGDPASELPAAERTARFVGTEHTPIELEEDTLLAHLPKLSRHRAAPVAETADLPIHLMSVEAARYVKVVLSGEGSDEMFAGYPKHVAEHYLARWRGGRIPPLVAPSLLALARVVPSRARQLTIAGKAMSERSFEDRMVRWFGALGPAERDQIWTGSAVRRRPSMVPFRASAAANPLRRALHFDQTSWLPDNLLERLDMMTMAASIEARAPFMDVRLAEFAASLPNEWRIKRGTTKRVVREALGSRLPKEVVDRPKNGFRMPVSAWFRGPLEQPFHDLLLGRDAVSAQFVNSAEVERLAHEHATGEQDHDKTLWMLFALETFLREFF